MFLGKALVPLLAPVQRHPSIGPKPNRPRSRHITGDPTAAGVTFIVAFSPGTTAAKAQQLTEDAQVFFN